MEGKNGVVTSIVSGTRMWDLQESGNRGQVTGPDSTFGPMDPDQEQGGREFDKSFPYLDGDSRYTLLGSFGIVGDKDPNLTYFKVHVFP